MFKLILLSTSLLFALSISDLSSPLKPIGRLYVKPVALVKYKDTVYHCQGIVKTSCGNTLHCGNVSMHCATDITVQYL